MSWPLCRLRPTDLGALLTSWELALRAERKSPQTVKAYGDGVRRFLTFCESTGSPPVLDRATVAAFVVDLLEQGAEASTARSRQLAVKRFSRWLADEDEIDRDQLGRHRSPETGYEGVTSR